MGEKNTREGNKYMMRRYRIKTNNQHILTMTKYKMKCNIRYNINML